ncbi:MAG TPA: FAD-binding protein [Candidatus Methylomirabilis sp.]|nr:FAD-binding protein [Candidatus Methylomirabilis sp.]
MTVTNWNSTASCEPVADVTPASLDELIAIVKDAYVKDGTRQPCPSPVRAVGSLHSLTPCFTSAGTIVHMKTAAFRAIGDPVDGRVTVGAGVTMFELQKALKDRHGLQIAVTPEIGNATAGSVACCGTKDASLKGGPGQISSTVVGVKMIDARGEKREVTGATDPERMRAIRSSYGLLGLVYDVTFETCPLQIVRYESESLELAGLTLERALGSADGFLGFLLPYNDAFVVERRTLSPGASPGFVDTLRRKARNHIWETGGFPFSEDPALFAEEFKHVFPFLSFRSHRVDVMIDFPQGGDHFFDFGFWAFPVSRWSQAIGDYVAFCREFRARTGFRPALPTEVYFISRDDRALLSFSPREDIFTLDMVHMLHLAPGQEQDRALWRQMNQEFNVKVALPHGARPLLNQTKELSRAVVETALGADWATFKALRQQEDGQNRFLSPYFADLL